MHANPVISTFQRGSRKVRKLFNLHSDYDETISPEIKDDEFYEVIGSLAATAPVDSILEIGSSTGEGSTSAFVDAIHRNPRRPQLYCMELSLPRFRELSRRFANDPQVKCYNLTSVPLERLPSDQEVVEFYRRADTRMKKVPLSEVLRWLRQDRRYIKKTGASVNGIRAIKEENGITDFGIVLIDGSEFSGPAELDEVYGARYILLDDICTFKNHRNHERLTKDPLYRLTASNPELRNGFAVFERVQSPAQQTG